jgi:hypothetical protein
MALWQQSLKCLTELLSTQRPNNTVSNPWGLVALAPGSFI